MNRSNNRLERRRWPRIKQRVPLKIILDDYDVVGQTQDLSCIGAYCTVNKYIPPFSIISVILLLPLKMKNSDRVCSVHCRGAVVRAEENRQNKDRYNIAIFFNRIGQADRAKLLQYVRQHL